MNKFIKAMLIRAIKTIAQTMLSMITLGMSFFDIDWKMVISVAIVSGIYSILTSIVAGLPEAEDDGELIFEPNEDGIVSCVMNLKDFKNGGRVTIVNKMPEGSNFDISHDNQSVK